MNNHCSYGVEHCPVIMFFCEKLEELDYEYLKKDKVRNDD